MRRVLVALVTLTASVFTAAAQHIETKSGIVQASTAPTGACPPSTSPDHYVNAGANKGKTYHCDGASDDADADGTLAEWTLVPGVAGSIGGADLDVIRNSGGSGAASGATSNGTDVSMKSGSQFIAANKGVEFVESDTNPTCVGGNYSIFADLSETALKQCVNGTASVIGAGGGYAGVTQNGTGQLTFSGAIPITCTNDCTLVSPAGGAIALQADDSGVGSCSSTNNVLTVNACGLDFAGGAAAVFAGNISGASTLTTNSGANSGTWQAPASGGAKTYTGPAGTGTLPAIGLAQTWGGVQTFTPKQTLNGGILFGAQKGFEWAHTSPATLSTRLLQQDTVFNEVTDHVFKFCINCTENGSIETTAQPHGNHAWEWSYDYQADGTINYVYEENSDLTTATTHPLGAVSYRTIGLVKYPFLNPPVSSWFFDNRYGGEAQVRFDAGGNVGIHADSPTFGLTVKGYDSNSDGTRDAGGHVGAEGPGANLGYIAFSSQNNPSQYNIITSQAVTATRVTSFPDLAGNVVLAANASTQGPAAWALAGGVTCTAACTGIGALGCQDSWDLTTHALTGNCTSTTNARACFCK